MRKSEVTGVAELLLQDYASPEEAATAIIKWLDQDRGKRTSYVAVMQFGKGDRPFYHAIGPYPGYKSAKKAVVSHPAACEASALVVVPTTSIEGVEEVLRTIDKYERSK